jgi:hypothetical protein
MKRYKIQVSYPAHAARFNHVVTVKSVSEEAALAHARETVLAPASPSVKPSEVKVV